MNKKAYTTKELSLIIAIYLLMIMLTIPTIYIVMNNKFKELSDKTASVENNQLVAANAADYVINQEDCSKRMPGAGLNYQGNGEYNYAGKNPDNWVKFDNKLWRIIGINSDNTLRLILSETIGTSKFNETDNSKFVGSTVQTTLNTWYNDNSKLSATAKSKIVSGDFCNATISLDGSDKTSSPTKNGKCTSTINANVGLMSILDYIRAYDNVGSYRTLINGYSYHDTYSDNWLFLTTEWTISPINSSCVHTIYSHFYINSSNNSTNITTSILSIRPVINLSSTVSITGGIGTEINPYVID